MKNAALLFLIVASIALGQDKIEYQISFDNALHHEAEVTVKLPNIPMKPLEVRVSRSSPGRYAIHEFGKNVYNVRATDSKGKPLQISQPNPYQWDISGHNGNVIITYTVFGDHADGTYLGIDATHAHLNMPATFLWAREMEGRAISVTFKIPKGSNWKIATQLARTDDPFTFAAPNLQYFMDSPTELSNYALREWSATDRDKTSTLKLTVHHNGTGEYVDAYAVAAKAVVLEEMAIFGELPAFDYGEYVFLADYLPHSSGDGMEHRNSTVISSSQSLKSKFTGLLGTLAHEFFHAWNVERIRPKSLEPFSFEEANMSGELWFAEGFTSYYGPLAMMRSGVMNIDQFAQSLSGAANGVINAPGKRFFSPVEMSRQAPFVDAATAIDRTNHTNTFISYYTWGAALGLGLDLTLRTKLPGVALDDLMRVMWQEFGKTEKPYTNEDIRVVLGKITKDQTFADDFFNRYIYGKEVPEYEKLLAPAGLLLRKAKQGKASFGSASIIFDGGKAMLRSGTLLESPFYKAGLDRGDRIMKIDGMTIAGSKDLDSLLTKHKPGEVVKIEYESRDTLHTVSVTLEEDRQLEIVPYEHAQRPITEGIKNFRNAWLGSKSPSPIPELTKTCGKCKRSFPFKFEFCQFDGDSLRVVLEQ